MCAYKRIGGVPALGAGKVKSGCLKCVVCGSVQMCVNGVRV